MRELGHFSTRVEQGRRGGMVVVTTIKSLDGKVRAEYRSAEEWYLDWVENVLTPKNFDEATKSIPVTYNRRYSEAIIKRMLEGDYEEYTPENYSSLKGEYLVKWTRDPAGNWEPHFSEESFEIWEPDEIQGSWAYSPSYWSFSNKDKVNDLSLLF